MDVVYILKKGSTNSFTELRFSLRSLQNLSHDRVFIIGGCPEWATNVNHIDAEDPYHLKARNAWHKIKIACETPEISEDFILMNDDFFVMEPIIKVPYYFKGYFTETIADYKARFKNSKYIEAMIKTNDLFKGKGRDFGVHAPIVYNKTKLLELAKKYNLDDGYLLRSLYCNHYRVKGVEVEDLKIRNTCELHLLDTGAPFTSTGDGVACREMFVRAMQKYFATKSIYEKCANII